MSKAVSLPLSSLFLQLNANSELGIHRDVSSSPLLLWRLGVAHPGRGAQMLGGSAVQGCSQVLVEVDPPNPVPLVMLTDLMVLCCCSCSALPLVLGLGDLHPLRRCCPCRPARGSGTVLDGCTWAAPGSKPRASACKALVLVFCC